jgi:EmrB/QacA subfamily drug resistance transporter
VNAEPGATRRLTLAGSAGRWLLVATVLGSGMALLDTTMVIVALPAIGRTVGGGLSTQQWVLDAYLITLAGFVLLGGALGEVVGHGRVFLAGAVAFGVTSAVCGVAPTSAVLIVARLFQGAAASLLVPGALALVSTSFSGEERGRAIGAWSGISGLATVIGPLLGGLLVDHAGWRWVFLVNIPLAAAAVAAAIHHLPLRELRSTALGEHLDLGGALTAAAGLGLLVCGLIEARNLGTPLTAGAVVLGLALLVAFAVIESRRERPLLPLSLFAIRGFAVANLTTLLVYGALSSALFLVVLELQQVTGYSALASGAAIFPITLLLFLLSPRLGGLVSRMGSRRLITLGPVVAALGLVLFLRVSASASYLTVVLPAAVVFGIGLALTAAPLTTTILGAVPSTRAGIASGVNNAVTRVAGLLAVAAVPLAAGLASAADGAGSGFTSGFHHAMLISAVLCLLGAVVSFVGLRPARHPAPPSEAATE